MEVCKPHNNKLKPFPISAKGPYSFEQGTVMNLPGAKDITPTQGWGQKEDTRAVSEEKRVESGRAERQCVKNSSMSPLAAALFIQGW